MITLDKQLNKCKKLQIILTNLGPTGVKSELEIIFIIYQFFNIYLRSTPH